MAEKRSVVLGRKGSRAECCSRLAYALAFELSQLGCNPTRPDLDLPAPPRASASSIAQPEARTRPAPSAPPAPPPKAETSAQAAALTRQYEETEPVSWRLSELSDVAPAGPATATSTGVAMVTMDGSFEIGRWQLDGVVEPIARSKDEFAPYARGPAFAGRHAYWIRGKSLVRRSLEASGTPELLADDAREGTRVAAAEVGAGRKAVVAYIAETEEELVARLWLEGGKRLPLTPEGSQATSVNLIPSRDDLLAIILEGRTSMSPVHARRLLLRGKIPRVGDDVVVWVGPPSQALSEVVSLPTAEGGAWSFVALERTVTDFGLARFLVEQEPRMDAKVDWIAYPNGINPAPIATGQACGQSLVAFARPSEARPRSPQELHIAKLNGSGLAASEVVARSRAFNNVSLAPVKGGALLTWTADWRTWARTIFCK